MKGIPLLFLVVIISLPISGCLKNQNRTQPELEIEPDPEPEIVVDIRHFAWIGEEMTFVGYIKGNFTVEEFQWDFNGDEIVDWSSTTDGNTTYTYLQDGEYNVTFTVIYDGNNKVTHSEIIHVEKCSMPPLPFCDLEMSIEEGDTISGIVNVTGIAHTEIEYKINSMRFSVLRNEWMPVTIINETIEDEFKHVFWNFTIKTDNYDNGIYDIWVSVVLNVELDMVYDVDSITFIN